MDRPEDDREHGPPLRSETRPDRPSPNPILAGPGSGRPEITQTPRGVGPERIGLRLVSWGPGIGSDRPGRAFGKEASVMIDPRVASGLRDIPPSAMIPREATLATFRKTFAGFGFV